MEYLIMNCCNDLMSYDVTNCFWRSGNFTWIIVCVHGYVFWTVCSRIFSKTVSEISIQHPIQKGINFCCLIGLCRNSEIAFRGIWNQTYKTLGFYCITRQIKATVTHFFLRKFKNLISLFHTSKLIKS